jgi:hypothetical protein
VSGYRYDDSPHRLDEFVTIDEVDALLADQGRYLARDYRRTEHFLQRVRTTLFGVRAQIQKLHRDVQASQARASVVGQPTTLDPRSAARFLPPEELASLGDELLREKFASMKRLEGDIRTERTELMRRVQLLKFSLATIAEDQELPDEVRQRVAAVFQHSLADVEAYLQATSAGGHDTSPTNAHHFPPDHTAGLPDAGSPTAGPPDTGSPDTGSPDAGSPDAGVQYAGPQRAASPESSDLDDLFD